MKDMASMMVQDLNRLAASRTDRLADEQAWMEERIVKRDGGIDTYDLGSELAFMKTKPRHAKRKAKAQQDPNPTVKLTVIMTALVASALIQIFVNVL